MSAKNSEIGSKVIISQDQCFGCKVFSVPLFYLTGFYFAHKNLNIWRTERALLKRLDRVGLVFIPLSLILGGTLNLYQA